MRTRSKPTTWDAAAASHLLSRAAFGGSPEEAARLAAMPREEAVDTLLEAAASAPMPEQPDWVKDPWVNTERRFADTSREQAAESHRTTRRRYGAEMNDLRAWALGRMIASPTPLRELMTLFWHGHFATAVGKVNISQAMYEQDAILRTHALGRFGAMVRAVTLSPAMMIYLDMEGSDKARPNENFARELLELFTVGIGHYTERDVKEIARALTGWTLDAPPGSGPDRASAPNTPRDFARDGLIARFVPENHDDGVKTVFGMTGRLGLDEVVALVARHEATGRFLAAKLVDFFGTHDPKGTLRDRLAATFAGSEGDIRQVLRVLFTADEFYADEARGTLIKSPAQLLVGACRQLKVEVEPTPLLATLTAAMGQDLFNPPNVKGWPGGKAWIGAGTLAVRYRLPEALIDGREPAGLEPLGINRVFAVPRDEAQGAAMVARLQAAMADRAAERRKDGLKCRFRPEALFPQGVPGEPAALVDAMLGRLVVAKVRGTARAALVAACASVTVAERPALVARLILASPEYQLS